MLPIGFGSVLLKAPGGIESKFELTKKLGGRFIEFYYQEMDDAGWRDKELHEIRNLSAAYDLPVTYHLPWHEQANDLGRYEVNEGIQQLLQMFERGFAIGARYMILHMGSYLPGRSRLAALDNVLRMIEGVLPELAENETVLCLENNTSIYTANAIGCSVFEMDTVFNRVRSPYVGMCLDTGHAHVNGCLMEMTDALAPFIHYIHLHDNDGVHDMHRAPGLGNIEWAAWYRKLAALPNKPWVMFEYPCDDGVEHIIADIRSAETEKQ